jgi:hypothetical protein
MSTSQVFQSIVQAIDHEKNMQIDSVVKIIIEYLRIPLVPHMVSPLYKSHLPGVVGSLGSVFVKFKPDNAIYDIPMLSFDDFQQKYDRPVLGWIVDQTWFLCQRIVTLIMFCEGAYTEEIPTCMIKVYLDLNQYHDLFWKWLADHESSNYLHTHLDLIENLDGRSIGGPDCHGPVMSIETG